MSIVEFASLTGIVGTIVCAVIGLYKYFTTRIENTKLEYDKKLGRVYERFDDYKSQLENRVVYKDMCAVLHNNNRESFDKLEKRVDDGFKELNIKFDSLLKQVLEQVLEK